MDDTAATWECESKRELENGALASNCTVQTAAAWVAGAAAWTGGQATRARAHLRVTVTFAFCFPEEVGGWVWAHPLRPYVLLHVDLAGDGDAGLAGRDPGLAEVAVVLKHR